MARSLMADSEWEAACPLCGKTQKSSTSRFGGDADTSFVDTTSGALTQKPIAHLCSWHALESKQVAQYLYAAVIIAEEEMMPQRREVLAIGGAIPLLCLASGIHEGARAQSPSEGSANRLIIGDQHGVLFAPEVPLSIDIVPHPGGSVVAGISLNGQGHGGLYGTPYNERKLSDDDYWTEFEAQVGIIADRLSVTYLSLTSRQGVRVFTGKLQNGPVVYKVRNALICGIGGWHGDWLNGLEIRYVLDYVPSVQVDGLGLSATQYFVGPTVLEQSSSSEYRQTEFFEQIMERSTEVSAAVSAQMLTKFATANLNYGVKNTYVEKTKRQSTWDLMEKRSSKVSITLENGQILVQVADCIIMKNRNGRIWIYPIHAPQWMRSDMGGAKRQLTGAYNFASGLAQQLEMSQEALSGGLIRLKL